LDHTVHFVGFWLVDSDHQQTSGRSEDRLCDQCPISLPLDALEQKIVAKTASEQDIQDFNRMSQAFNLKQQQFVEDNALMVQRSKEQIATQLNQYLEDFTKEQGYDYIFGATGAGSLMGAKEAYNVTDEVLRYANERYKGGGQ